MKKQLEAKHLTELAGLLGKAFGVVSEADLDNKNMRDLDITVTPDRQEPFMEMLGFGRFEPFEETGQALVFYDKEKVDYKKLNVVVGAWAKDFDVFFKEATSPENTVAVRAKDSVSGIQQEILDTFGEDVLEETIDKLNEGISARDDMDDSNFVEVKKRVLREALEELKVGVN